MLTEQARYFPIYDGKYSVNVGAKKLEDNCFGNGVLDGKIFQIDNQYYDYISFKKQILTKHKNKCFGFTEHFSKIEEKLTPFLFNMLNKEYPDFFIKDIDDSNSLFSNLTSEEFYFNDLGKLIGLTSINNYSNSFDALISQIQEDVAIIGFNGKEDFISAIHISMPNYWTPVNIIGKSFKEIHREVPNFSRVLNKYNLFDVLDKKPFTRFVWGIETDNDLGHLNLGKNEDFVDLYLRIERQVIYPLPEAEAIIFTIRPYVYDSKTLSKDEKQNIVSAIEGMDEKELKYKGFENDFFKNKVIDFLAKD